MNGDPFRSMPWLVPPSPPWHLWGNSQTLTTQQTGGSGVGSTPDTQQMVRVSYRRPETWHWVFQSRLLAMPTPGLPGTDAELVVHFDLTIGVGRSSIQIPDFDVHRWYFQNPAIPPTLPGSLGNILRTTRTRGLRNFEENSAGVFTQEFEPIDQIVAQDIQLQTRLILTTSGNGFTGSAEVSCYFAPKTHVRPEWFSDFPVSAQFPGAEVSGQ